MNPSFETGREEALDAARPPGRQGFRMPAEWEPHAATWLAWPHKEASWPGKLERIPPIFAEMVRRLAPAETVHINVADDAMAAAAEAALRTGGVPKAWLGERIQFHLIPTDDAWARDHGPIFVTRGPGELAVVDWEYNAWGGKYPPYANDNRVPGRVAALLGLPVFRPGMVLEGGSIEVNGRGTLLTTEACLLHPNRNPQLDRAAIEARLCDYLGVGHILWLGEGIAGDDTDGHVDDLARFVSPQVVVTVVEEDRNDANHEPLRGNLERLRQMRDERGRSLEIHTLPMPAPVEHEGQRLPASYANFYIGNRVVLLPQFECAQDAEARRVMERLFPGREIAGLDCRDLVWGLGAFHCLTQQQPA
ncbi:MAG: agmatine deiminase family protein [Terriglobales bacterium]